MSDCRCKFCNTELVHSFADLGDTPLSNSYLSDEQLSLKEPSYPLHARLCHNCFLIQIEQVVPADAIFSYYAYLSSMSSTWVEHARRYAAVAVERFGLGPDSMVVEIASNDGYLLRNFVECGIPCLGIEPAANIAKIAEEVGVRSEVAFFGRELADRLVARGDGADLAAANNVIAHVPDLNDFVGGIRTLLKPDGVISIEVPHLMQLIDKAQFDTIYHEHFSYFSLFTLEKVFAKHGLRVFDVEQISTHGGSLRVWVCRVESGRAEVAANLDTVRHLEEAAGVCSVEGYQGFGARVARICTELVTFVDNERAKGRSFASYGASAKGNTLFNVAGVGAGQIMFAVDRNPIKQSHFLPGSKIPIYGPEAVEMHKPDYLLITPWNIAEEIREQMSGIRAWGGKFVVAVPELQVS